MAFYFGNVPDRATLEGDDILFEVSSGWVVEFAETPDPSIPMRGFGWGMVPSRSTGTFARSGYFTADDRLVLRVDALRKLSMLRCPLDRPLDKAIKWILDHS